MAKTTTYTSKKGNQYKIAGGVYTGFSCMNVKTNKWSVYGFDNAEEVKEYIDRAEGFGKKTDRLGFNWDLEGVIEGQH